MSIKEPGIMFDATNSWNGYNHQGKIALFYAISEINKLIKVGLSKSQNRQILEKYFLEIEYMEDFSIGEKTDGHLQYHSVHQVKDRLDVAIGSYESSLLGLAKHLIDDPTISDAFLHVTRPINLNGKNLNEHIAAMVKEPKHLNEIENQITQKRYDLDYRNIFLKPKRGGQPKIKKELLHALLKKDESVKFLTESNLDVAFDELLKEIYERKRLLSSITIDRCNCINFYQYTINDKIQSYCQEDQAERLVKNSIQEFYIKIDPNGYKKNSNFVDKSYLYLLGKLDQHIVDRSLNFEAYKKEQLERQILFSTIFEWLLSDDIDKQDSSFYLYHIKEAIYKKIIQYCKMCRKKADVTCSQCQVPVCKEKLSCLNFQQLKEFLHITNPHISGDMNMNTYGEYAASSGINNPFLIGLRDIPQDFLQNQGQLAVVYQDLEQLQYVLTAIASENTDDDNTLICSEIIKNRNVYGLMMDYDCFISKDICVKSIQGEGIRLGYCHDSTESDHIAHCKNVKIVPLTTFKSNLETGEENSD